MTDNIIDRTTAIDRMRDGLPCDMRAADGSEIWGPALWIAFYFHDRYEFRIPPEPRREAREWWISPAPKGTTNYDYAFSAQHSTGIHVREVLPDEMVVRKETLEQIAQWADSGRHEEDFEAIAKKLRGLLKEDK